MPIVRIAHSLPRAEVRRRMTARVGDLAKLIPGGIGTVSHDWVNKDVLKIDIAAMGRTIASEARIEKDALAIDYALPPGMGVIRPMVEGIIRKAGDKLLLGKG